MLNLVGRVVSKLNEAVLSRVMQTSVMSSGDHADATSMQMTSNRG